MSILVGTTRIIRDPEALGRVLAATLGQKNIRQEDVESEIGVDQGRISRIINGKVRRYTKNVAAVCEYAKVNAEPYLAPVGAPSSRLEMLARAASAGDPEREMIVGRILVLLEKLR